MLSGWGGQRYSRRSSDCAALLATKYNKRSFFFCFKIFFYFFGGGLRTQSENRFWLRLLNWYYGACACVRPSSDMLFCLVVVLTFRLAVGVKSAKPSSIYARG